MSALYASLLSQTIDDHISWITAWTRRACFDRGGYAARNECPPLPVSFNALRDEAVNALQALPTLTKLASLHEQLTRLAPLALWKAPEGMPVSATDYDGVVTTFQELMKGLRYLEHALVPTKTGLDQHTSLRALAGMRDDLMRELSRFQRSNKPFSLAIMAIDSFAKIKATQGRESGRKILSAASNYLCCCLRPFDDAWPWGEEEILICLKDADLRGANLALARVRDGLQRLPITMTSGKEINVSASFGIATVIKDATVDDLLLKAGNALTRARVDGKGRIESARLFD